MKNLWREFRYLIGPPCLEGLVALAGIVPWEVAHLLFVRGMGSVAWWLTGPWRGKMRENMAVALGDRASARQRDRIARAALRNMFLGFLELVYSVADPDRVLDGMTWQGENWLKGALQRAKGVIAVTAHLGNFTLMPAAMIRRGYPFKMIIKDPKHPRMARTFQRMRRRQGVEWIPASANLGTQRKIMRSLALGEIVGFVADEGMRRGGIVVEFLGRPRAMPPGPAFYHLMTGAPILPLYLMREGDGGLKMVIKPPIEVALTGDRERDLYLLTKAVTQELQDTIREHPEQWHWVGRTRPKIRTRRTPL